MFVYFLHHHWTFICTRQSHPGHPPSRYRLVKHLHENFACKNIRTGTPLYEFLIHRWYPHLSVGMNQKLLPTAADAHCHLCSSRTGSRLLPSHIKIEIPHLTIHEPRKYVRTPMIPLDMQQNGSKWNKPIHHWRHWSGRWCPKKINGSFHFKQHLFIAKTCARIAGGWGYNAGSICGPTCSLHFDEVISERSMTPAAPTSKPFLEKASTVQSAKFINEMYSAKCSVEGTKQLSYFDYQKFTAYDVLTLKLKLPATMQYQRIIMLTYKNILSPVFWIVLQVHRLLQESATERNNSTLLTCWYIVEGTIVKSGISTTALLL